MKKTLKMGKKALSVFMAALMVMTAWVFFAPEKAEAATAGSYTITLYANVDNELNDCKNRLNVTYKTNHRK